MRNAKPVGPVTAAIRAMRNEEMAEALADISQMAADASDSIIAILRAAADNQAVKAMEEGVLATRELQALQHCVQAAMSRLEAA